MRKPLLCLSLLLGLASQAQAQTGHLIVPVTLERREYHYGVFGSFHASHYTATNFIDYTFLNNGGNGGLGGGVFIDMFFSPNVAFTVSLNTGSRGGKFAAIY